MARPRGAKRICVGTLEYWPDDIKLKDDLTLGTLDKLVAELELAAREEFGYLIPAEDMVIDYLMIGAGDISDEINVSVYRYETKEEVAARKIKEAAAEERKAKNRERARKAAATKKANKLKEDKKLYEKLKKVFEAEKV